MSRVGSVLAFLLCCDKTSVQILEQTSILLANLAVALVELVVLEELTHQLRPTSLIWMAESICWFRPPEAKVVVEER